MADSRVIEFWVLAVALVCISVFCCNLGKADEVEDVPERGGAIGDPAEIVARALACFNNKYIYSSCEESYRLTQTGNLHVPPDYVEEYCNGPCLRETHMVLNCVENIFEHFLFYNRATIQDVRETVKVGCGYGPERGHFNVAEHIEAEENGAQKAAYKIMVGLGLMVVARALFMNI